MGVFDDELKRSVHFADVMNTHRTAMAEVLAALLGPLLKDGVLTLPTVLATLKDLERGTERPSADGERRHAVSVIREAIQRLP